MGPLLPLLLNKYHFKINKDKRSGRIMPFPASMYNSYKHQLEGNVLFNIVLNTILRLYGDGHMINDRTDNEREHHFVGYSFQFTPSQPST